MSVQHSPSSYTEHGVTDDCDICGQRAEGVMVYAYSKSKEAYVQTMFVCYWCDEHAGT